MTIPSTRPLKLDILQFLEDGNEHTFKETLDFIAKKYGVSTEERKRLGRGKKNQAFVLRVTWGVSELRHALLLANIGNRRGIFKITPRGLTVLKEKPKIIDAKFLNRFSEFKNWKKNE